MDVFGDRVVSVGFVGRDGVGDLGRGGGEERVEPPQVEQTGLLCWLFGVEVRDPADHQPTGHLLRLGPGSERCEGDLGDLGPGDPRLGPLVEDGVGVLDRCPPAFGDVSDEFLTVPTDKGANPGLKVSSLVAGMMAGADSIDDMAILRHGGMGKIFDPLYAPSTLGSFLRAFTFGHVRRLDAVACRVLAGLGRSTPLLDGVDRDVLVDVHDTIIEVHGYAKQGAGFGYSGVRGINALIATVTVADRAPIIAASRLRKGSTGSPKGASRLVADTLATVRRLRTKGTTGRVLLRADSAFYGQPVVHAAQVAGAQVSITVRQDPRVKAAIATRSQTHLGRQFHHRDQPGRRHHIRFIEHR